MNNKYSGLLIISSILFIIVFILFCVFTVMPIVNIILGNSNPGYILVVISIPISTNLFFISLCFFIVSLVKFLDKRKQIKKSF